jgi:hypothetical protein
MSQLSATCRGRWGQDKPNPILGFRIIVGFYQRLAKEQAVNWISVHNVLGDGSPNGNLLENKEVAKHSGLVFEPHKVRL